MKRGSDGLPKSTKSPRKKAPKKAAKSSAGEGESPGLTTASPEWTTTTAGPLPPVDPPAAACCSACDGLTGTKWGIPWRNAAGVWKCLVHDGGDKVLAGDASGPYWQNP